MVNQARKEETLAESSTSIGHCSAKPKMEKSHSGCGTASGNFASRKNYDSCLPGTFKHSDRMASNTVTFHARGLTVKDSGAAPRRHNCGSIDKTSPLDHRLSFRRGQVRLALAPGCISRVTWDLDLHPYPEGSTGVDIETYIKVFKVHAPGMCRNAVAICTNKTTILHRSVGLRADDECR